MENGTFYKLSDDLTEVIGISEEEFKVYNNNTVLEAVTPPKIIRCLNMYDDKTTITIHNGHFKVTQSIKIMPRVSTLRYTYYHKIFSEFLNAIVQALCSQKERVICNTIITYTSGMKGTFDSDILVDCLSDFVASIDDMIEYQARDVLYIATLNDVVTLIANKAIRPKLIIMNTFQPIDNVPVYRLHIDKRFNFSEFEIFARAYIFDTFQYQLPMEVTL